MRTLGGSGSVTLASPSLPLSVGAIALNASTNISLTLNVPSTVTRFSLTENGSLQDTSGSTYNFSAAELVNVSTYSLSVSPSSLTFAAQNVGTTSSPQTITVANTGNQPIAISSIAISGTNTADFGFATNSCPASLSAAATCSLGVTFSPTALGTRTAAVTVTDNATGSPQTVSLTGSSTNGPPAISISPAALTFSAQNIGTTSPSQTINVTNTGTQPISFSSIALAGANPADFALASNACGSSLAVGLSCALGVTFSPTAAGTRTAAVNFTDNVTGSPQSVSLSGVALGSTSISVNPTSLTFPTQNTGTTSAAQTVTINNTGNQPVTISSITLTGANAGDYALATNTCPSSLAVAGTCSLTVKFSPTAGGTRTAAVTITDNATGSPQSVTLTGTGQVPATTINVTPSALTFATQNTGTTSAAQTVTISNTGNQSVTISSIALTGTNAGDYALVANNCPSSLAVSANCSFGVTFSPTASGPRSAAVAITDNANGSPQSVTLTGTGLVTSTSISVSPSVLTYPTQNTGTTSAAQTVTISNTGNQPVAISSFALSGTNAGDYALVANNCPSSLAVSANCSFGVTFSPTAAGTRSAAVSISDNATGSPQSVTLTGTGQVPTTTINVSPATLTFSTQFTGTTSSAQTVTISNTGNQGVAISSVTLSGTNAADYALVANNCPSSLAVGANCSFGVTFSPTAAGTRTAAVTITDNASGSPQLVTLTGVGQVTNISLSISPTSLTFATQITHTTSSAQTVTISNVGNQPVTISSIALTGANAGDYAFTGNTCPASLAVSGSCLLSLTFTPTAAGTRSAAVTITDNANGSPQSVALTGTGQAPTTTISLAPTALTFSLQFTGTTSAAQTVTVTNTGNQPVTFTSVALAGTNASDFALASNTCTSTLAVSANCSFSVTFSPTAAGARTASVNLTDNASGSPQSVPLSGTGQVQTTTISLAPTALTFSSQFTGTTSAAQTVTVTNTGNQPVTFTSVALSGANAGDFALASNTCTATLAVSANCSFSVTFSPTAAGARAASVNLTDNASGSPQSVPLSGTGQAQTTTITLNPASLTFSTQITSTTSAAQTVTVSNTGNQPVTFTSVALAGTNAGDFALASNSCTATLAVSANCSFSVTFTPTAAGARTASVNLTDNASGSPQSVPLSGTGQVQTTTITVNPTSVTFNAQNVGSTSASQSVTIANTGNQTVTFSSFALAGANPGDYTINSNSCGTSLAVGNNCSFSITFTPTTAGPRTASVTITDNAASSPQSVTLSGTGQNVTTTITHHAHLAHFPGYQCG